MTTQQTTQAIWWTGDSVSCVAHVGTTLKCAMEKRPKAKSHTTRFGKAYLLTQEEIAELITFQDVLCETCKYEIGA